MHTLENITTYKSLEKELRESEEKFRSITTSAQDAILMIDDKGKISYWNRAAEKIFGYSEEEVIGHNLHDLITPKRFMEAHKIGFKHFIESGEGAIGKTVELVALKKDGTEFPIELSLSAVKRNSVWNAIGILRDISERKKSENLLKHERDFFNRLVNTAPVIILTLNTDGQIISFNDYMENLTGYSLDEVKGKDWFSTFLPKYDREKMRGVFHNAIGNFQTHGNVNPIITKSGEERIIEWYDKTLLDTYGDTAGLIIIGLDITKRKQTEEHMHLFRTLIDHSSDAIEVIDTSPFRFLDVNETECNIYLDTLKKRCFL